MKTKAGKSRGASRQPERPEIRDVEKIAALLDPAHNAFLRSDLASLKSVKRSSQALARSFSGKLENLLSECLAEATPVRARRARPFLETWHNLKMIAINISNLCDDFQITLVEDIEFSHLALDQCRRLLVLVNRIFRDLIRDAANGDAKHSTRITASCRHLFRLVDRCEAEHEERLLMGICSPRACSIFSNMLDSLSSIGRYLFRLNNVLSQADLIRRQTG